MDAGEGWNEEHRPEDYTPTWKRDRWNNRPIHWNKRKERYEEVIPYAPKDVDDILNRPTVAREYPRDAFDNRKTWNIQTGYGGSAEWPFDFAKACLDDGYRRGVWNAMHAMWTSKHWKLHAQKHLDRVWRVRRRAAQAKNKYRTLSFEQALEEQLQYNAF